MKLYKDPDGHLKGDGLCCYLKVHVVHYPVCQDVSYGFFWMNLLVSPSQLESINLALQILHESNVRGHTISVERVSAL